jgi:hypothetical protein
VSGEIQLIFAVWILASLNTGYTGTSTSALVRARSRARMKISCTMAIEGPNSGMAPATYGSRIGGRFDISSTMKSGPKVIVDLPTGAESGDVPTRPIHSSLRVAAPDGPNSTRYLAHPNFAPPTRGRTNPSSVLPERTYSSMTVVSPRATSTNVPRSAGSIPGADFGAC